MARISGSMLHVEKFLCFISLRGGTLFSLYATLVFWFHAALMTFSEARVSYGLSPYALFFLSIMIKGVLVSCFTLLYFPEIGKKYDTKSINVRCILYFSIFSGLWAIIGFILIFSYVVLDNNRLDISVALFSISYTGSLLHFTAVTYSFYLSILKPKSSKVLIKIRIPPLSSDLPPPRPPRDIFSINHSGNLYVETT
ncbi:uncharacterized protein LOC135836827 isoform X2 [Planococcus citri]|uniref:uncharacterized protein LOC135836827 isoform X2 n=1 Tax=Planococcus citri TaxID=170843 RepID=UPI0031F94291